MKNYFNRLYHILRLPEMLILPGNLAFFLILSIIPLITLIGLIASLFSLSTDALVNFVNSSIPHEVSGILVQFINGSNITITSILFIVVFFVASNGPDSIITASNILYDFKNEGYIKRRSKALFLTSILMLLIIIILVFLAFGSLILKFLLNIDFLGTFITNNYLILVFIKYFIGFLTIFILIKFLYTLALDKKIKSKYVNKGALFSTVTIIISTSIYSFYVTNFGHYDIIYGSLANIAILMFLIYLISHLLIIGMAINSNHYKLGIIGTDKKDDNSK